MAIDRKSLKASTNTQYSRGTKDGKGGGTDHSGIGATFSGRVSSEKKRPTPSVTPGGQVKVKKT